MYIYVGSDMIRKCVSYTGARFEVFTAVKVQFDVLWVSKMCSFAGGSKVLEDRVAPKFIHHTNFHI
jgi:hypothetical protein